MLEKIPEVVGVYSSQAWNGVLLFGGPLSLALFKSFSEVKGKKRCCLILYLPSIPSGHMVLCHASKFELELLRVFFFLKTFAQTLENVFSLLGNPLVCTSVGLRY